MAIQTKVYLSLASYVNLFFFKSAVIIYFLNNSCLLQFYYNSIEDDTWKMFLVRCLVGEGGNTYLHYNYVSFICIYNLIVL